MNSFLVQILLCANAFDTAVTCYSVAHGATERNPAMRTLIDASPFLFLIVKLFGISALIIFLGIKRRTRALFVLVAVYLGVALYHLHGLA